MPDDKEREPLLIPEKKQEAEFEEDLQDVEEEHSLEAESVIDKIEKQRQRVSDVQDGTTVVNASLQPAVTLPVTQDEVAGVSKIPIVSSLRWLVEWARKQIKKLKGRVKYRREEENS